VRGWILFMVLILIFPSTAGFADLDANANVNTPLALDLNTTNVSNVEAEAETNVEPKTETNNQVQTPPKKVTIAQQFKNKDQYASNELVIKFRDGVTKEEKQELFESHQLKEHSFIAETNLSLVEVHESTPNLEALATSLSSYPQIEYVEPNFRVKHNYVPKDSYFSKQWYLNKIEAPKAWDMTKGSADITVAVIDGGVQLDHPDLKGKLVKPYNAANSKKPYKADTHGTHVAGIIAASLNNKGTVGIAPNVKIMPINVFTGDYADQYSVVRAINYAVNNKANVINLSLGGYEFSYSMQDAIEIAHAKGVTLVAAAGNSKTSELPYPANYDKVLAVSATNRYDKITAFSNYGGIGFSAPGEGIYSTISGSSYKSFDGTSMASPIVTGIIALMLSKNPLLTPNNVKTILEKSSIDLGAKGWDHYYGGGRVNAYRALINTPVPMSDVKVSPTTFTTRGHNQQAITFNAHGATKASVYVKNKAGAIVKRLMWYKPWVGGTANVVWDGKLDNGTYASSGSYQVIASVTNGIETQTRNRYVNIIDKIVPTVHFPATVHYFSPVLKTNIAIPYQLNKQAKVTAALYDPSGRKIKTFLSSKELNGGKWSINWNAKDEYGRRVKDGTYKLAITSSSTTGSTRKLTDIVVDSVKPSTTLDVSTDIFKVNGKNRINANLNLKEKTKVTAYILNASGSKIRKLAAGTLYQPGLGEVGWNGLDDSGILSNEGTYSFLIELTDLSGNRMTLKSNSFTMENWLEPTIIAKERIEVFDNGGEWILYQLNKPGTVSIDIYRGEQFINQVVTPEPKDKGDFIHWWRGEDQNGQPLPDGMYRYVVHFKDHYGQKTSFTGEIAVSRATIKFNIPSAVQADPNRDPYAEINFSLGQPSLVSIYIKDSEWKIVRTLTTAQRFEPGSQYFTWDGKDEAGLIVNEDEGYDWYMRVQTLEGKGVWLSSPIFKGLGRRGFNINVIDPVKTDQSMDISISTDNDVAGKGSMTMYTYKNATDPNPIETIPYPVIAGKQIYTYTKPTTEPIYYRIVYKDELGNSYVLRKGEM
jgi:subtilisin family serine protease/flagellar hook assembly protein FlgD